MAELILALDLGTTSTRAVVFDKAGAPKASHSVALKQYFPKPGWVEHDASEIWQAALACCRSVIAEVGLEKIAALGITNQRETTVLWDRTTGMPVHNAIVWQDRRTAYLCEKLEAEGWGEKVQARTGLLLDPYFSATKLAWLLENVAGARARADKGELAFGTIESWLVWNLTGGAKHITDASNAARTMIYDISKQVWDAELLTRLDIPMSLLPQVVDVSGELAEVVPDLFGRVLSITGLAGDQQAAAVGQACFEPGMMKSTYGTGCFVMVNTGGAKISSAHKLLTTTAYRIKDMRAYALEGSIFMAGGVMQWLRDSLGLFEDVSETAAIAASADPQSGVVLVPAFTGLGAPHWAPHARAAILGLTRGAGKAEIVRAGLESVAFQTYDLKAAIAEDLSQAGLYLPDTLRVDGGMAHNDWFLQFLADILEMRIERPPVTETTALGVAYLAGLGAGLYSSFDEIAENWRCDTHFEPKMGADERNIRLEAWRRARDQVLVAAEGGAE